MVRDMVRFRVYRLVPFNQAYTALLSCVTVMSQVGYD